MVPVPGAQSSRIGYRRVASGIRLLLKRNVAQDLDAMEGLLRLIAAFLRSALAVFRSRGRQAVIELALRQQLAVYSQAKHKPRLRPVDRAFYVGPAVNPD